MILSSESETVPPAAGSIQMLRGSLYKLPGFVLHFWPSQ